MSEGQTKFYEYYLKRVKSAYQKPAEQLLNESFERQERGDFDDLFIERFIKESQTYIEAEKLPEVLEIINHFCNGHFNDR